MTEAIGPSGANGYFDESVRAGRYLLACALVAPGDVGDVRRVLRTRLSGRQRRLHFASESLGLAEAHLLAFAALPVSLLVYETAWGGSISQAAARRRVLEGLVRDLGAIRPERLVLDWRQGQDAEDAVVLRRLRRQGVLPSSAWFDHVRSDTEELLWLADGAAWAVGRGGRYRQALEAVLRHRLLA